jgi:hypothetical protein
MQDEETLNCLDYNSFEVTILEAVYSNKFN